MKDYPEIAALNELYITHQVEIQFSTTDFLAGNENYRVVVFKLSGREFKCYVEDEKEDIRYNYPLLNLCLFLRELEGYADSPDFLVWAKERYFDPKNEAVRAHFNNLGDIYREVEKIIGKIDSQISDWDFEMESGASWALRKKE